MLIYVLKSLNALALETMAAKREKDICKELIDFDLMKK